MVPKSLFRPQWLMTIWDFRERPFLSTYGPSPRAFLPRSGKSFNGPGEHVPRTRGVSAIGGNIASRCERISSQPQTKSFSTSSEVFPTMRYILMKTGDERDSFESINS